MFKPVALTLAIAALGGPATASASWLPATDLAPGTASDVGDPSLAVAPDGTAFVAFVRSDGAHPRAAVRPFHGLHMNAGAARVALAVAVAVAAHGCTTTVRKPVRLRR